LHEFCPDRFLREGKEPFKRFAFSTAGCVLIVTDHSDYDYQCIVRESQLVVDTRNATRGIQSSKIVRC